MFSAVSPHQHVTVVAPMPVSSTSTDAQTPPSDGSPPAVTSPKTTSPFVLNEATWLVAESAPLAFTVHW